MDVTIESILKLVSAIGPIIGGVLWLAHRGHQESNKIMTEINKNQAEMLNRLTKMDKHKVSHKLCEKRRAECPCKN